MIYLFIAAAMHFLLWEAVDISVIRDNKELMILWILILLMSLLWPLTIPFLAIKGLIRIYQVIFKK